MVRYFYAGNSFMGTQMSYDTGCWKAYRFTSRKERDQWVDANWIKDGHRVSCAVTHAVAMQIIGYKKALGCSSEVWEQDGDDKYLLFRLV